MKPSNPLYRLARPVGLILAGLATATPSFAQSTIFNFGDPGDAADDVDGQQAVNFPITDGQASGTITNTVDGVQLSLTGGTTRSGATDYEYGIVTTSVGIRSFDEGPPIDYSGPEGTGNVTRQKRLQDGETLTLRFDTQCSLDFIRINSRNSNNETVTITEVGGSQIFSVVGQTPGDDFVVPDGPGTTGGDTITFLANTDYLVEMSSPSGGGVNFDAIAVTPFIDTDNDNLSDNWELQFTNDLNDLTGLLAGPGPGAGTGDFDGDGLSDLDEQDTYFTNPVSTDSDSDSIPDGNEVAGEDSSGTDTTLGATDPADADSDDDGIPDDNELDGEDADGVLHGFGRTNPNSTDSDADGMGDGYELANNNTSNATGKALNPNDDGSTDPDQDPLTGDIDGDGIVNLYEFDPTSDASFGTAHNRPQTRADLADTDADGYTDGVETNFYTDGSASQWFDTTDTGTDPTNPDTDGDGLADGDENQDLGAPQAPLTTLPAWSDPTLADTDADTWGDGREVTFGFDPQDAGNTPAGPVTYTWDGTTDMEWGNGNWSSGGNVGIITFPATTTNVRRAYVGDSFVINNATVNSSDRAVVMDGGTFTAGNSTLTFLGDTNVPGIDWGRTEPAGNGNAVTATLTNCTVLSQRVGGGGNACRIAGGSDVTFDGGSLEVRTGDGTGGAGNFVIDGGSDVQLTNGAQLTLNNGRLNLLGAGTLTLESGSIMATGLPDIFNGDPATTAVDFTGAAGSATVTQENNSETATALAAEVTSGTFYIDGTRIDPATDYDGSNLATVNAELAALSVGGRAFEVTDNAGVQTLSIVVAGATGAPTITNVAIESPSGDLLITYDPAGTGHILTSSNDLVTPFAEVLTATRESGDTVYRVPAADLNPGRDFFRIETP